MVGKIVINPQICFYRCSRTGVRSILHQCLKVAVEEHALNAGSGCEFRTEFYAGYVGVARRGPENHLGEEAKSTPNRRVSESGAGGTRIGQVWLMSSAYRIIRGTFLLHIVPGATAKTPKGKARKKYNPRCWQDQTSIHIPVFHSTNIAELHRSLYVNPRFYIDLDIPFETISISGMTIEEP